MKDVPWDQALDIILQAKSLGMRKNGTVIWVAPKDELAAKEKSRLGIAGFSGKFGVGGVRNLSV